MDPSTSIIRLSRRYPGSGATKSRGDASTSLNQIAMPARARRVRSSPAVEAATANRRVSKLYRVLNSLVERKHVDTSLVGVGGVSTGGTFFELSSISQGDTETQRSGLKVTPQKLFVDLSINAENPTNPDMWRVIVFRWDDDTPPAIGSILTGLGTDTLINWPVKPKYRILSDEKIFCEASSTGSIRTYRKVYNFPSSDKIMFNASTPGSGEWGRLFMLLVTNSAVVPHPACSGNARLQFMDV